MANLWDLIVAALRQQAPAPAPSPTPDPARPWDDPSLRVAAPSPYPSPSPTPTPALDPWSEAEYLAQRQEAARKLTSPMSPILEIPQDLLTLIKSKKTKEKK